MLEEVQLPLQVQWASYFLQNYEFSIIPIYGIQGGKCTCGKMECTQPGKHPMTSWKSGGYFKNIQEIRQFWQRHPNANYGILTEGLLVLDLDERNGGVTSFEKNIGPLLSGTLTLTVRSGSGGESRHFYFFDREKKFKNGGGLYPGIDIRAVGGYIIGIGSNHISGNRYDLLSSGSQNSTFTEIAEIPEPLMKMLLTVRKSLRKTNAEEIKANLIFGGSVGEGYRNNTLASYAGALRQKGLVLEEIQFLLLEKNKQFDPPLSNQEVNNIARSISRYSDEIKWEEPDLSFAIKSSSYQDMPEDLIPDVFKEYAVKKQRALGVPVSAIMVSLTTIISAVLGAAFKVSPYRHSDYQETLNLWGIIIAPPSSRKTSILNILSSSFKEIDNFFYEKREQHKHSRELEYSKLKKDREENKKSAEKKFEIEEKLAKLTAQELPYWCFFTSESTPEALALIFKYNHRGILLFKDELEGLFALLTKQGFETLRALLNEGWNGGKPFKIIRVGRGIIDIKSTTISILGGIQPDVLTVNFREELQKGLGSDGLLARFQLCSIYNSSDLSEPDSFIDTKLENQKIEKLLLDLHDLTKQFNVDGTPKRETLYLSIEAAEVFSTYIKRINHLLLSDDVLNQAYKSHVGKFGRLVLSLSAQFHIVDSLFNNLSIDRPIEIKSLELAIGWADYMAYQAQKMYFSIGKSSSAKILVSKIKNKEITDGMSVRAIYRKGWSGLQSRDEVLAAFESIDESNWSKIVSESPRGGGAKTDIVRINPKLTVQLNKKNNSNVLAAKTDERGDV